MKISLPKPLARCAPFPRSLALSMAVHGMAFGAGLLWARPWERVQASARPSAKLEFHEPRADSHVPPAEVLPEIEALEAPLPELVERELEELDPIEDEPLWPLPDDGLARVFESIDIHESFERPAEPELPAPALAPVESALEPIPLVAAAPDPPVEVAALLIEGRAPDYPPISRRFSEEGSVLLDLYVLADGRVERAELVEGSGFARLDRAAVDVVLDWSFEPATRDGMPIESVVRHRLTFRIDAGAPR